MIIDIKDMTKIINGVVVLEDINCSFESEKIYGLSGKNGSGKTMLMRTICGLVVPTKGSVNINGLLLHKDISFPPSVGVLIEKPSFISDYNGFQNLKILSRIKNIISDTEIIQVLYDVGLAPHDKKPYRKYSLGMKQRLGIACAIMEHPNIILLDEPTNALDENGVSLVRNILIKEKKRGAIIILACHDKEELEYISDTVILMEEGRICKLESEK